MGRRRGRKHHNDNTAASTESAGGEQAPSVEAAPLPPEAIRDYPKRLSAILAIKITSEYAALREGGARVLNEGESPAVTPDWRASSVSKRSWERSVQVWRKKLCVIQQRWPRFQEILATLAPQNDEEQVPPVCENVERIYVSLDTISRECHFANASVHNSEQGHAAGSQQRIGYAVRNHSECSTHAEMPQPHNNGSATAYVRLSLRRRRTYHNDKTAASTESAGGEQAPSVEAAPLPPEAIRDYPKRLSAILAIKITSEYAALREGGARVLNEGESPAVTPDWRASSVSKRSWERSVQVWRKKLCVIQQRWPRFQEILATLAPQNDEEQVPPVCENVERIYVSLDTISRECHFANASVHNSEQGHAAGSQQRIGYAVRNHSECSTPAQMPQE